MNDDLSAPLVLGRDKGKRNGSNRRTALLPVWGVRISVGLLASLPLTFLGWLLFADAPLGGEPMVVVPANLNADAGGPAVRSGSGEPHAEDANGQRPNCYDGPQLTAGQDAAAPAPGTNTVTIIDGSNGKRQSVVIPNTDPSDNAIEQRGDPEKTAQERGVAVGMANALPVSIERIADWAKTAENRGIVLVSITAIVGCGKST